MIFYDDMLKNRIEHSIQATIYSEELWMGKKSAHEQSLGRILDPYLKKRSHQQKDPVLDFLFEYYPFRISHLKKWTPGVGVLMEYSDVNELPEHSELITDGQRAHLNPLLFPKNRRSAIRWILQLLEKSQHRKPMFGCFGMHEWAMVYRTTDIRHDQIPLRLSDDEIAEFVESRPLLCTHFDAFRFFTEKAQPMNKNRLSRENFEEMEQPGCVHTNMDLYKWTTKIYPWVSGELLHDAFLNAAEARKIDMQASPYDATEFGLDPIRIETEEGRKVYLELQMEIYQNSIPIRERLIHECRKILEMVKKSPSRSLTP